MKRNTGNIILLVVIVVLLLTSGTYIIYKNFWSKNNQTSSTSTSDAQVLSTPTESDFPTLYPGVKWTKTYEGELLFRNNNDEIVSEKGETYESEILKSEPGEIISYFRNELQTKGWIQTDNASGPEGLLLGYQKNQMFFTVQYQAMSEEKGPERKITGYKVIVDHN